MNFLSVENLTCLLNIILNMYIVFIYLLIKGGYIVASVL